MIRKRRLTQQQQRRIQQQQHRYTLQETDEELEGLIVQHYGRQLAVKVLSLPEKTHASQGKEAICVGDVWRCHTRTNLESLVTGDRVKWLADPVSGLGIITALYPRTSLLTRPDRYHKIKPVAANISLIVIVLAPLPEISPTLIDRYLVACAEANIAALLVLNKIDLLQEKDPIWDMMKDYQQLGYDVISCHKDGDLSELQQKLKHQTVAFVGQSGVGKSSLINALVPEAKQLTHAISENSALGQHTTTSTRWIDFGDHSALIDSPGIREFGLWHLQSAQIRLGFPDIQPFLGECRFRNCTHTHEKHCALKEAVLHHQILQRRLDSYLRLTAEANEASK